MTPQEKGHSTVPPQPPPRHLSTVFLICLLVSARGGVSYRLCFACNLGVLRVSVCVCVCVGAGSCRLSAPTRRGSVPGVVERVQGTMLKYTGV
jgi:hypothetical protein